MVIRRITYLAESAVVRKLTLIEESDFKKHIAHLIIFLK